MCLSETLMDSLASCALYTAHLLTNNDQSIAKWHTRCEPVGDMHTAYVPSLQRAIAGMSYSSLGSGASYVTLIDHTVTQINHALIPINHVSTVVDRPWWAGSLYRWNIHWLQKQMYVRMYVWWCTLAQRDAVIFRWDMVFESPIIVSLFKYLARMTWHPT